MNLYSRQFKEKMLTVQVTTANKISSKNIDRIKQQVEKKYNQKVVITETINPKVIGGISLTIGSDHFDNTVSFKLSKINQQLDQNI